MQGWNPSIVFLAIITFYHYPCWYLIPCIRKEIEADIAFLQSQTPSLCVKYWFLPVNSLRSSFECRWLIGEGSTKYHLQGSRQLGQARKVPQVATRGTLIAGNRGCLSTPRLSWAAASSGWIISLPPRVSSSPGVWNRKTAVSSSKHQANLCYSVRPYFKKTKQNLTRWLKRQSHYQTQTQIGTNIEIIRLEISESYG